VHGITPGLSVKRILNRTEEKKKGLPVAIKLPKRLGWILYGVRHKRKSPEVLDPGG
jgi:hypothetical protein